MSRSLRLYLDDILKSINKIQRYTTQMSQDQLVADERTFDAVVHNLQIIGEATKSIPEDIRNRYTSIDWQKIIGLRNIIVHTYFSVDDEIIWDTALCAVTECSKRSPLTPLNKLVL
ncbi:HepT-like ribonuclease domain-containing protein [Roseofilum capinflatum]|uniref:DUF86 domain-containing protein n=1 Tax=Roseofilum capinflatum BLCC-M114 TaxID=3022440 RepID=A0ABT7B4C9_9CYAN|nr:DUF86 domain-containing protein [Roseofilum capinflatum]MDJ1174031.1 DUF86 domain-containing protein [Roseofilum capinflatum BLCC-M114]